MKLLEDFEKTAFVCDAVDESAKSTDSQSSETVLDNSSGGVAGSGAQTSFASGDTSFSINQGGALALAQSSVNNNLYIDVDFEGTDDTMGDLQSPQYVKRTAHMFDSRFSSDENGANGHDRNGRNPSYLNVSRSVSGYSCLTYNNGTITSETVSNKSVLGNGTSLLTGGARSATKIKTDFALHSPFSRTNKAPSHTDEDSDHSSSQSTTSPPPSLPPINTAPSGRYSAASFFQNGMNRGDDLLEETPYIPSHGKSFVMQRIERLYGSDAVSKKGVLTRKSSHVTTISITRESPPRGGERIIPISVEPRDDHENNLYNSGVIHHEITKEDRDTGRKLPGIVGNEENGRRISRGSLDDTDEDEDTIRTRSHISPTKLRSSLDNTGHLNGNANFYGNGHSAGLNGKANESSEDSTRGTRDTTKENVKLEQIIHTNGNHSKIGAINEDDSIVKKQLSRESSADSDDTNGCSENSLELGISDVKSKKVVVCRRDSQDSSLYSNRDASSPTKPKPKPKPKDMALLRTLSRSPALKTCNENLDKTAILNIVQPEADLTLDIKSSTCEDHVDADNSFALPDIKNTISAAPPKTVPESKVFPSDNESQLASRNKENTPSLISEDVQPVKKIGSDVKDGNYFLNEMKRVTQEILKFSEHAAKELESIDESEDRAGCIHAAIGKGNLLVKKKFKQFEELCNANLRGSSGDEPVTTNEDLAGFWDMVMIQVDQVYGLFAELENKEQKSASAPGTPSKPSSPRKAPASTSKTRASIGATPKASNNAAAKARDEARRKMLAERRKAMKSQMQEAQEAAPEEEAEVVIFAPDTPHTG